MCGVAAFVGPPEVVAAAAQAALPCLAHRGPDDRGVWIADDGRAALAHTRLAVLDVTEAAHQPMASPSGRYRIAYNGEIYNHLDLRRELEGFGPSLRWRGTGDTETLVAALDRWGLEGTLRRCTGMFALAVWDRQDEALLLARDRVGEKPLAYGSVDGTTFAVSDLRAIPRSLRSRIDLDPVAIAMLGEFDHIAGGRTILQGVRRVPPGAIVRIRAGSTDVRPYWSVLDVPRRPGRISRAEAVDEAGQVIEAAVASQRLSDVPLGVFLSGGIDSSLVAALLARTSAERIRTFTIGFEDEGLDESRYAAAIAGHLGTEHTEVRFGDSEVVNLVPHIVASFDEPLGDPSVLPTMLLCRITRPHVTVALSGDGGDEVFGGYDQYWWYATLRRRRTIARSVRPLAQVAVRVPGRIGSVARGLIAATVSDGSLFRRLRGRDVPSPAHLRTAVDAEWDERWWAAMARFGSDDAPLAMDFGWYLADDILVKVDRAAMGVSLETRAPLLDRNVLEFAFALPPGFRTSHGPKWILRDLLSREVPPALFERPKRGFGAPIPRWLAGPLRDWAEDLLLLGVGGSLEPWMPAARVQSLADEWRSARDSGWRLWTLLQLLAWQQSWTPGAEP